MKNGIKVDRERNAADVTKIKCGFQNVSTQKKRTNKSLDF